MMTPITSINYLVQSSHLILHTVRLTCYNTTGHPNFRPQNSLNESYAVWLLETWLECPSLYRYTARLTTASKKMNLDSSALIPQNESNIEFWSSYWLSWLYSHGCWLSFLPWLGPGVDIGLHGLYPQYGGGG